MDRVALTREMDRLWRSNVLPGETASKQTILGMKQFSWKKEL